MAIIHSYSFRHIRNHQKETHTKILQLEAQNSSTVEKVAALYKQTSIDIIEKIQIPSPCVFCQLSKSIPSLQNPNLQELDLGMQNCHKPIGTEEEPLQIIESSI